LDRHEVGIIGYGSSVYEKIPTRSELAYLWDSARAAAASAGVRREEIDGLAISSTTLGGDNAVTAAEHFGLTLGWAGVSTAGGAGALTVVASAMAAVERGAARIVLCLAGGVQDRAGFRERVARFNGSVANYLAPHGIGGMNGLFGLIQAKHMRQFGTASAQLGRIAVDQRWNAAANPQALLRQAMSLDDYLTAPLIADPLRLYDCVLPCSGAEAVVVGPLDRVEPSKQVAVTAYAERHNHLPGVPVPLSGGWEHFRATLFDRAGLDPKDVDFVQAYDDYPIMVAIQLEDLGFCAKGEIGPFLQANRMSWDGSFPLNTGGGQLSCGQAGGGGGMIGLVEAVRQLRGEAGARQIAHARRGVVSGYGMVAYGHGLSASAMVVARPE
jgi:acetyl-CoA acetyltransferase